MKCFVSVNRLFVVMLSVLLPWVSCGATQDHDSLPFGKRIDDPSRRPIDGFFSFQDAELTRHGNVKLEAAFDPGKGRNGLIPCYISQIQARSMPFVDRFQLIVYTGDHAEHVIEMAKAFRDPEAGAIPLLYSISIPTRDIGPALSGFCAIGFELDDSKIKESIPEWGELKFPLSISVRFIVRFTPESDSSAGLLQVVQTERCEIRKDDAGRLVLSSGGNHGFTCVDAKGI